jgi:protein phosphatase-4 regulatory subunit 3
LGELFHTLEGEKKLNLLPSFFFINKALLQCTNTALLDRLLSDDYYLAFFGALEYDPDLQLDDFKPRKFFQETAVFRNVLGIRDDEFLAKIHKTYRFTYLKDSTFTRLLDDNTVNYFSTYHVINQNDLIYSYTNSPMLRSTLSERLNASNFEAF